MQIMEITPPFCSDQRLQPVDLVVVGPDLLVQLLQPAPVLAALGDALAVPGLFQQVLVSFEE